MRTFTAFHGIVLISLCMISAACIQPIEDTRSAAAPQRSAGMAADDSASEGDRSPSTPEVINAAFAAGEISEGERILYLAYAIYEPASLPPVYSSDTPWRGTMIVREIDQTVRSSVMCDFSPEIQRELRRLIEGSNPCT